MNDLISRQAAIDEAKEWIDSVYFEENDKRERKAIECFIGSLKNMPSAQQWHVIKKRPMTNDERIEWSEMIGYDIEYEDAFIYSNLPDDGEEVLVSSQCGVYIDKFFNDEVCYFEYNGDMDGIVAWMPLPEPYKGEES